MMVEVVIATLILALAVSSFVAGMLSTTMQARKVEGRDRGSRHTNALLQELRNYVTAAPMPAPGAPGNPAWHLPGDACAGCWALSEGRHDVTALLPAELSAPPLNARMTYTVTLRLSGGDTARAVDAEMTWDAEP